MEKANLLTKALGEEDASDELTLWAALTSGMTVGSSGQYYPKTLSSQFVL
ncbi:MAG: hypothetical protein SWJ54_06400 [Cyanobacteriota bacterium]|nr:hypothetical protein [Cyanobacteriota bacterium]